MGQTHLLIPGINSETKNWTARITITEDISVLTCGNNSKLKRYIMTDEEGNEITAVVFASHIPILVPMLQLFHVYDITNASVRFVEPRYRIINNPYQWVLQRETMICPIAEAIPNLRHFLDNLTPFSMLANTPNSNQNNIDIMGVVVAAEDATTINTINGPKSIQRFTFVDMEKIPICVTLWEEMTEMQGSILTEAANTLSVVVAKRLSLSTFKGPALSAKKSSSFTINPPIEAVAKLKSWIDSRTVNEVQELLVDQSITISKELVSKGTLKTYTVSQLANIDKFWVKGYLQISEEDHKLFYIGCSNCSSRTSVKEEGIQYTCYNCRKEVITTPRAFIFMTISDNITSMKVVAIANIAEQILQTTAEHIFKLSKLGQSYDVETLKSEFNGKMFLMLLRRTFAKQSESQKKMVLSAFYEDSDDTTDIQSYHKDHVNRDSSGKGKLVESSQCPLSPLKRQMSQISLAPGTPANKKLFIPKDVNLDESNNA